MNFSEDSREFIENLKKNPPSVANFPPSPVELSCVSLANKCLHSLNQFFCYAEFSSPGKVSSSSHFSTFHQGRS